MNINIHDIFLNLETINETISEQQSNFQIWLEERREEGMPENEILDEINSGWGYTTKPFNSIAEAEEWFDDLGI
jgi:hypothetical protein